MKRVLSIVLVFLLCLSLCACGSSAVAGKWTATNKTSRVYIYLNKDHTGEMESEGISFKFTWEYDDFTNNVTIDFEAVGLPGKLKYVPEDDTLVFLDGTILSRVG